MHPLRLLGICALVVSVAVPSVAQQTQTTVATSSGQSAVHASVNAPRALGSAHAFSTIQGNALNSLNAALPSSPVRLRDARYGRIVGTQMTDHAGLFSFGSVD